LSKTPRENGVTRRIAQPKKEGKKRRCRTKTREIGGDFKSQPRKMSNRLVPDSEPRWSSGKLGESSSEKDRVPKEFSEIRGKPRGRVDGQKPWGCQAREEESSGLDQGRKKNTSDGSRPFVIGTQASVSTGRRWGWRTGTKVNSLEGINRSLRNDYADGEGSPHRGNVAKAS